MDFKIYQIKDVENCSYAFRNFSTAEKYNFKLDDYREIYSSFLDNNHDESETLEDLFYIFNSDLAPTCYKGRSLSVSDIVEINGVYYYCDSFGWVKLDNFQ